MKRLSLLIALALAVALAADAGAHQCWLTPSTYRAAAGDTVVIASFVGTGFRGEQKPYAATRALRLTLQAKKTIDLRPGAMNGDLTYARFIVPDDQGAVVAYHSTYVPIELDAAEFNRYLALEGLDAPLRARVALGSNAGPGRERYARCAKTWIAGADLKRLLTPIGMPLELVPLGDPATSSTLRIRLLYQGRPLAGALVKAWNQPLLRAAVPRDAAARDSAGISAQARTDTQGVAALPINRPGEWMISTVYMIPSRDRAVADWESLWASLTFARLEGVKGK